jgi:ABC-2 type transport system permease protein
MKKILRLFGLFILNTKLNIAKQMEYRFNFILTSVIALIFSSVSPLLQYLIFTQTKGFPGWTLDQIILFQGVLLTVLGLQSLLFGELQWYISDLIWRGELDRLLLKPYPPIGIILTSGFSLNSTGSILAGIIITVYSVFRMRLVIGIFQIVLFLVFIAVGLMLSMALNVLYSCMVIVLVRLGRMDEIFAFLSRFGEYPIDIYSNALKLIFTTAVPFAVWVYIPAKVLLGALDVSMALSLVCTILFFLGSLKLWDICLKKYTSAGG